MIKRLAALLGTTALIIGLSTGCAGVTSMHDDDCKGDPGRVTAKETDHDTHGSGKHKTRTTEYDLTVLRADGTTYDKEVSSYAYDHAYKVGGKFPHPTKCKNGKAA